MPNEIRINNLLDQNNSFLGYQDFRGKPKLIEIKLSTNFKGKLLKSSFDVANYLRKLSLLIL